MNNSMIETLSKLISDCKQATCPIYSTFFDSTNAQSTYRKDQLKRSLKFKPPVFTCNDQHFGAKLVLLMESPPPVYLEYFYDTEGGFEKSNGLFSNVMRLLIKAEGPPVGFQNLDNSEQLEVLKDKEYWLKWASSLGFAVVDAAKCRLKISSYDLKTEKVSNSQIEQAFHCCNDILKIHLKLINPFRIAIGIASVYDASWKGRPFVVHLLREIGFEDKLIKKKTVSIWARNNDEFQHWFPEVWNQAKSEFNQLKQSG